LDSKAGTEPYSNVETTLRKEEAGKRVKKEVKPREKKKELSWLWPRLVLGKTVNYLTTGE